MSLDLCMTHYDFLLTHTAPSCLLQRWWVGLPRKLTESTHWLDCSRARTANRPAGYSPSTLSFADRAEAHGCVGEVDTGQGELRRGHGSGGCIVRGLLWEMVPHVAWCHDQGRAFAIRPHSTQFGPFTR